MTPHPCVHGHKSFRYTITGQCGECLRTRERGPQKPTDPAARKATLLRWNASDKALAAKQKWRNKNPKNAWACSVTGQAKKRAHDYGLPFDIDKDYVGSIIPDVCPVFGVPFEWQGKKIRPESPTLDRLKPELGYIRGNVAVISLKANAIKSNATAEEVETVAAWMRRTIDG